MYLHFNILLFFCSNMISDNYDLDQCLPYRELISCYVRIMLFLIENWYCHGFKISKQRPISGGCHFWYEIKKKNSALLIKQYWNIFFYISITLVYLSTFKNMASPTHDQYWAKNGKTLARLSYHWHFPKFPSTIQVTVENVSGISAAHCVYIFIYTHIYV